MLFILIVVAADTGLPGFVHRLHEFPLADKLGHFALYGMLNLLTSMAVCQDHPNWGRRRVIAVCAGLLTLVAGIEEWSQLHIPSRTFSLWDLAAGIAGITTGALFAARASCSFGRSTTI